MKRSFLLIAFFFIIILAMENCKHEHPIPKVTNTDPDSLYVGQKYTLVAPPNFPPFVNPYVDSLTYEGVALGRRLFYDKHLSGNGSMSCASCHILSHAFSDSGKALSTGINGPTFRNTTALINLAWSPYYNYDGSQPTLTAQAQNAFHSNLSLNAQSAITYLQTDTTDVKLFKKAFGRPGTITEPQIYKAIQEFLLTAISANSRFDVYLNTLSGLSNSEINGYTLFMNENGDCFHCHMSDGGITFLFTDNLFRNDGIDTASTIYGYPDAGRGAVTLNPADYGKFKDPTMRNIALTGPYMHDGRYTTLTQVVNFYSDSTRLSPNIDPILLRPNHNNGAGLHLAPSQVTDLVNFLGTLTDTSFLDNPNLSNPFH